MAWENAPVLNKLTASPLIGKNGAQIWGVDHKGRLYTNYQMTPGGRWDGWMTNSWHEGGYPEAVYELCAAQTHEGETQLWVLDMKRQLWSIWQDKPGNWSRWSGPNWFGLPNHIRLKKIAAVWQGPWKGTRVWGITEEGKLITFNQAMPSGNWLQGSLADWPLTPHDLNAKPPVLPAEWIEVTACTQGDGKGALWALDTKMQLWGMGQKEAGGDWGPWSGPNWLGAKKMRNIAAVETTVERRGEKIHGACIFGITDDYKIVFNEQSVPGGNWFGWSEATFKDEVRGYEITAARQNNQSARVWVISNDGVLVSQQVDINSSPPGWERYWTPDIEASKK
ncbi:MAG TPA: hypothetical protein VM911_18365 [Pyrinomonadaceae bacterium]|nr:hypothetical protein [Pyrinomonadaceae bacterium]